MPDLPQNDTTTAVISLGDVYTNELETVGDRDWIRLETTNGQRVTVTLQEFGENPLNDTHLRIYDASGALIGENDDVIDGDTASQISFTPDGSGPYYAEAAAYDDGIAGGYQLALNDAPLSGLFWGTQVEDTVVTVYFVPSGDNRNAGDGIGTITSEGFNAYERAQFIAAFDQIEAVSGLQFQITNNPNADFQLVLDTNEINGEYLGLFNPPGEEFAGVGVFDGSSWDRQAGGDLQQGGFGYTTIVHELLHGLGLAHPHDTGGSSAVFDGVDSDFDSYGRGNLNQGIFTTMSYNTGYFTGTNGSAPSDTNFGHEFGPMALDIAVLQELYGTGGNHKNGNSVYTLENTNQDGIGWQAIWDTGGIDLIQATGNKDAFIDLRAATLESDFGGGGYVTATRGVAGGFTIANGVVIENANGAGGDDTLSGNSVGNRLDGNGGNDTISGREGADIITGDGGKDTLNGGSGKDRLFGGADNDRLDGGVGDDTLDGQKGNDSLHGRDGDDILYGSNGNDRIWGGYNEDRLLGGTGNDQIKAGRDDDTAYGGSGADSIYGEHGRDELKGGSDNDRIFGNANDDRIWGETGNDQLYGGTGRDKLKGGKGQDTLNGGNGNDSLWGEIGDDRLNGGSGTDLLIGGTGMDVLTGGSGADRFDFNDRRDSATGAANADVITDFETGIDKIDLRSIEGDVTQTGAQDLVAIGGASFSNTPGEVRWVTSGGDTIIYVNNNADQTADMEIHLSGVTGLTSDDFLL